MSDTAETFWKNFFRSTARARWLSLQEIETGIIFKERFQHLSSEEFEKELFKSKLKDGDIDDELLRKLYDEQNKMKHHS